MKPSIQTSIHNLAPDISKRELALLVAMILISACAVVVILMLFVFSLFTAASIAIEIFGLSCALVAWIVIFLMVCKKAATTEGAN